jgi:hypothetical protein
MDVNRRLPQEPEQSHDLRDFPARYFALFTAIPSGELSPMMKLASIAVPVVASYSPTVPESKGADERKGNHLRVVLSAGVWGVGGGAGS